MFDCSNSCATGSLSNAMSPCFVGISSSLFFHHRDLNLRRILLRMVDHVVSDHALGFVVVLPTSVQVPIKARKVAARYLKANPMASLEVIARSHRLQRHLIHLPGFHPYLGLIVAVPIPHALDRL